MAPQVSASRTLDRRLPLWLVAADRAQRWTWNTQYETIDVMNRILAIWILVKTKGQGVIPLLIWLVINVVVSEEHSCSRIRASWADPRLDWNMRLNLP